MEKTLRELVDLLPTQSLDLYVQAYEAGEVGGYVAWAAPVPYNPPGGRLRCPCAALGFHADCSMYGEQPPKSHPARVIETMAKEEDLDTAALYDECVLAIAERDAELAPEPAPCPA